MRKRYATISHFHCLTCKAEIPLPRWQRRAKGHYKHIWCYKCKRVTKHLEEGQYDFKIKENIY